MSDIIKTFLSITFFISSMANAAVIPITPYGISASGKYSVLVNGGSVFTGAAGGYSFCTFDFDGSVTVRVTTTENISQINILPTSLGINYNQINNRNFEFTLDEPEMITVQVNGDLNDVLHLFTSAPETNVPSPGDPDVIYYAGGNEYNIGVLELQDNETLYIEAGAKLNGMIFTDGANNVTIRGRGMIDGTDLNTSGNYPGGEQPWRLIYMRSTDNIVIEGITLYNSKHWTVHLHECIDVDIDNIRVLNFRNGSDGTNLSSCQNVTVTNSFYHAGDDCIAIKSLSFLSNTYPNMNVNNILIQGCTLLNYNWGSALEIGYELQCNRVSNITYRDCDIIRAGGRGSALSIHNTDPAIVENVLYEDIRIENATDNGIGYQLFNLAIFYSVFSIDSYWDWEARYNDHWDNMLPPWPPNYGVTQWRGNINNITYRDIEVLDGNFPYSIFHGWDSGKNIDGVVFDNIIVNGEKITSVEALQLDLNNYAENIQFILNDGEINNDGKIDYKDFALFRSQWLDTACGYCGGADFNDDNAVDANDLNIMSNNWLADLIFRGHWKLDGNAADSSWYNHSATIYGTPEWDPNGRVDEAVELDGIDDYIKIDNFKGIGGGQSRTVSAWIKTDYDDGEILTFGTNATTGGRWVFRVKPGGYLNVQIGGGTISGTTVLTNGLWHHVAAVFENDGSPTLDEVKLYVDGNEEAVPGIATVINTIVDNDVKIGVFSDSAKYFNGLIDEVRIYSRALTQAEIQALAGMGD